MKKVMILIAIAAGINAGYCETNETVDVMTLMRARYERDMKTESGRSWWHGKRLSCTADPSNEVQVSVYEDGARFRDKAKVTRPIDSVTEANKKLARQVDTTGVPKKLAEARKRRAKEKSAVSNVVEQVTAGK